MPFLDDLTFEYHQTLVYPIWPARKNNFFSPNDRVHQTWNTMTPQNTSKNWRRRVDSSKTRKIFIATHED
jgi:hypothetical protein